MFNVSVSFVFKNYFREFEVDSNHFVGQVHRWRLSLLLQKGTHRAHSTLLDVSSLSIFHSHHRFIVGL